ncbi:MAG: M48 family metallopeptidase [Melioribacteraceae bacterium]|nr:M48 family metallopeptidase [Melioribacteraceae bacterium]
MNYTKQQLMKGSYIIEYEIIYSSRKTLEIAVHPDSSVVVTAPLNTSIDVIKQKVEKRIKWINKQQQYFQQFQPRSIQKQYLRGESHLYLGKHYRLKVISGLREEIKLKHGYFVVSVRDKEDRARVKNLLEEWYIERAKVKLDEYFKICWYKFSSKDATPPILKIRKMKKRWGSLSKSGTLILNTELIKAPKECIEYVITHELCHTVHHNHSAKFYNLLKQVMPDWEKLKNKLELNMS